MRRPDESIWLRLSFAFYLAALVALGFRYLSPLGALSERAIWSDLLVVASAVLWLGHRASHRTLSGLRTFHIALALYLGAGGLSAAFALDRGLAVENVAVMVELATLALLTSVFGSQPARMRLIGRAVCFTSLSTAALAIVGLGLFYAGVDSGLIGVYGEQFIRSDTYARVQAGFYSPPLLASFCIFASAVMAREDIGLSRRWRVVTQVALSLAVVATLSRAVLGFAAALMIRAAARHRDSPRIRTVAAVGVVGCLVVIAGLTVGRLHLDPTRPETITYEVPDPHNRREAFAVSLEALGERPLTGEGPGSLTGENRGEPFRAHLTPLNIAATMGISALFAFTFLIVALWRNRRRPTPVATCTVRVA